MRWNELAIGDRVRIVGPVEGYAGDFTDGEGIVNKFYAGGLMQDIPTSATTHARLHFESGNLPPRTSPGMIPSNYLSAFDGVWVRLSGLGPAGSPHQQELAKLFGLV